MGIQTAIHIPDEEDALTVFPSQCVSDLDDPRDDGDFLGIGQQRRGDLLFRFGFP